jgi:hypothetical protein
MKVDASGTFHIVADHEGRENGKSNDASDYAKKVAGSLVYAISDWYPSLAIIRSEDHCNH